MGEKLKGQDARELGLYVEWICEIAISGGVA